MVFGMDHRKTTEPDDMVFVRVMSFTESEAHIYLMCKGFSVGATPGFLKSDDIWLLLLNDAGNEWKPIFSSSKNIVTEGYVIS